MVNLVEEMMYLEKELSKLRTLPKIRVTKRDKYNQKPTAASKLYKEYLQQYLNVIKTLSKITDCEEDEEESPLRAWLRKREVNNG